MNTIAHLAAAFFAGAFLANSLPHLAAGTMGRVFPTPFAKPRGIGDSSPLVNFLWGSANLGASVVLLHVAALSVGLNLPVFAFVAGWLLLGAFAAVHFGKRGLR